MKKEKMFIPSSLSSAKIIAFKIHIYISKIKVEVTTLPCKNNCIPINYSIMLQPPTSMCLVWSLM